MTLILGPGRAPPVRAARRARLGWCVPLVVCAHIVVLAMPMQHGEANAGTLTPARVMQVRVLPQSAPDVGAAGVRVSGASPAAMARAAADRADVVQPAPQLMRTTGSMIDEIPVGEPGSPQQPVPNAEPEYLSRTVLSVAPRVQAPVAIEYPYFDGEQSHYTGEFDLFIDDTGGVVRVVTATPDLPGILSDAVRQAFLSSRFTPGERDGHPVRSRIRIEVTFDSRAPSS